MRYASAERVVLVEKKFEKTFENPLTNSPMCGIILVSGKGWRPPTARSYLVLKCLLLTPVKK